MNPQFMWKAGDQEKRRAHKWVGRWGGSGVGGNCDQNIYMKRIQLKNFKKISIQDYNEIMWRTIFMYLKFLCYSN